MSTNAKTRPQSRISLRRLSADLRAKERERAREYIYEKRAKLFQEKKREGERNRK